MELAWWVKRLAVAPFLLSFGWITLTKLTDRLARMFDLTGILFSLRGDVMIGGGAKAAGERSEGRGQFEPIVLARC